MKCPWREDIYIYKKASETNINKTVEWLDCYKEQCPFWDNFKRECRRAEHDSAKSV